MDTLIITNTPDLESIVYSSVKKALNEIQTETTGKATDFLDLNEASKFLNLAKQTIYGLTCKREIPFFKRGKKLYFRETDLILWLEKGKKYSLEELKADSAGLTFKEKGGMNE